MTFENINVNRLQTIAKDILLNMVALLSQVNMSRH